MCAFLRVGQGAVIFRILRKRRISFCKVFILLPLSSLNVNRHGFIGIYGTLLGICNLCENIAKKCAGIFCSGSLSCTHTKWVHKLDFPHMDWPMANFPLYQYPMEKHWSENSKKDADSLQEVLQLW